MKIIILLFYGLIWNSLVFACSCVNERLEFTFQQYFEYEKIFTGKVDSVQEHPTRNSKIIFITTQKFYKGQGQEKIEISSTKQSGSCPANVIKDSTYLFFTNNNSTYSCDRTRLLYRNYEKMFPPNTTDSLLIFDGTSWNKKSFIQVSSYFKTIDSLEIQLLNKISANPNGKITSNYSNGRLMGVIEMKNYELEGFCIYYDLSGKKIEKGNYIAGIKSGLWLEFNRPIIDNQVYYFKSKGKYKNGLKDGIWKSKLLEGNLKELRKVTFDPNCPKRTKVIYEEGKLIEKNGT